MTQLESQLHLLGQRLEAVTVSTSRQLTTNRDEVEQLSQAVDQLAGGQRRLEQGITVVSEQIRDLQRTLREQQERDDRTLDELINALDVLLNSEGTTTDDVTAGDTHHAVH